jgi:starch phosphorylase
MAELTPRFSANRMLREYVERLYLPATGDYLERIAEGARKATLLCRWHDLLQAQWSQLRFGKLETSEEGGYYDFKVTVYLGKLDASAVAVQLYAEPLNSQEPEVHLMTGSEALGGTANGYLYNVRIPAHRPVTDYTPRIIPVFKGAKVPLEARQILWYE